MSVHETSLRALVVDDEIPFARAIRRALEHRGFACGVAYSVASGLDAVESNTFDVVISDLQLGATSGLLLLSEVRSRCPEATTILMTGWVGAVSPRLVQQGFVDAYIEKPFDLDALCQLIARTRTKTSGVRLAAGVAHPEHLDPVAPTLRAVKR